MSSSTVDNPFFARVWTVMARHEPESIEAAAAGEPGRPVGSGARSRRGHGDELRVVSRHGDRGRRRRARAQAGRTGSAGGRRGAGAALPSAPTRWSGSRTVSRSTRWCARWCCARSMNPISVVRQLLSLLRPGGELRYLEHVAGNGARARLQKIADATLWPRMAGNCHTHRHTEETIVGAGFEVSRRAPRVDGSGVGARAGRGVRDRPRGQALA